MPRYRRALSDAFALPERVHEERSAADSTDPLGRASSCELSGALSWLSLGQPSAAPAELNLGRPLSGEQRGAVRRLERATRVLARHTEVGPADMGRAAAKVEAVEKQLARLEQITLGLSSMCKHYLGARDEMHYHHDRPPPGSGPSPLFHFKAAFKWDRPLRLGAWARQGAGPWVCCFLSE